MPINYATPQVAWNICQSRLTGEDQCNYQGYELSDLFHQDSFNYRFLLVAWSVMPITS